jgi:hypothetical protein
MKWSIMFVRVILLHFLCFVDHRYFVYARMSSEWCLDPRVG